MLSFMDILILPVERLFSAVATRVTYQYCICSYEHHYRMYWFFIQQQKIIALELLNEINFS